MSVKETTRISSKKIILCCLCGALVGFVNGFFGGGGGMICVPLLSRVLNYENKVAHASAISIIFPLSFVSACVYSFSSQVEISVFLPLCVGVVFGGICGSFLLKILPEKIVRIIFVFIMLFGGIKMIF